MEVKQAIELLDEIREDSTIPKNVKLKLTEIVTILKDDSELSIKINKALSELDDVTNDSNLDAFVRTQIYQLVSFLESLQ